MMMLMVLFACFFEWPNGSEIGGGGAGDREVRLRINRSEQLALPLV